MKRSIIGVDIGSSALKIALWNGTQITRLVEEPMPEQLVVNGNVISSEALAAFLKEVLKRNKITCRRAAVLLPPNQVFVQQTELPLMTEAQLKLNLPYEFRDFITEDKDKFFFDYALVRMIQNEEGVPSGMLMMAAAVSKSLIQNYENLFRWAGLKLVRAIPVEMAYVTLLQRYELQHPEAVGKGRCIVDFGHNACRAYFFSGDAFEVMREGNRGSASLDELLADLLQTDVHIARSHKETGLQGELDRPEVQATIQDIVREIQRAVNFYNYSNPEREIQEVYLGGGGSRIEAVSHELRDMIDIRIYPMEQLLEMDSEEAISCAGAIGAALQ